jgi:hypothetical protein
VIDPNINEEEALAAFLESDGWQFVQAHLDREWGPEAYARQIDAAIVKARAARDSAEQDIGELGAAARAVRLFAQWPAQRLAELKAERQKPAGRFAGLRRG